MYETGFGGFDLYDQLETDEWECVITPPHTVTEEKCQRKKNDRTNYRRLIKNLDNGLSSGRWSGVAYAIDLY
jgi:hypothetical protein